MCAGAVHYETVLKITKPCEIHYRVTPNTHISELYNIVINTKINHLFVITEPFTNEMGS